MKRRLAAVGFGVAVGLVLGEGAVRLIAHDTKEHFWQNPIVSYEQDTAPFFEFDERYGHRLTNGSFVGVNDPHFVSFEDVLERIRNNSTDTFVLNLGDSSTSGWNSDVVTENKQRRAAGEQPLLPFFTYPTYTDFLDTYPDVTAVNAGIPGYSTMNGLRYLTDLLSRFREEGVQVDAVTLYFGNNDSLWNNTFQDSQCLDESSPLSLIEVTKQAATRLSARAETRSRVPVEKYEQNLQEMVSLIRSSGSEPILIQPPIPLYWHPGLRAVADSDLDRWLQEGKAYHATGLLERAIDSYHAGIRALDHGDLPRAREEFEEAARNDFIVPRIKPPYAAAIQRVGNALAVSVIDVRDTIPFYEREAFGDYCHPLAGTNKRIAEGIYQALRD